MNARRRAPRKGGSAVILHVKASLRDYEAAIGNGSILRAGELFDLDRKALVVTDDGVPEEYARIVARAAKEPVVVTLPQGESSKSVKSWQALILRMMEEGFDRHDCVVAVGGGMVGDLAGFAASTFMRGIDFYTVPTTVLAQVDASVGGKTALNAGGVKNAVGAFYPPAKVLIDPELPKTQTRRQRAAGLAEALKIAAACDAELFELFEREDPEKRVEEIVCRALQRKIEIVEKDEFDRGARMILNFGHTLGHGVEAATKGKLYHGECVALGMLPMSSEKVRGRLLSVYEKLGLPAAAVFDRADALEAVLHDKKAENGLYTAVVADKIGICAFARFKAEELEERLASLEKRRERT